MTTTKPKCVKCGEVFEHESQSETGEPRRRYRRSLCHACYRANRKESIARVFKTLKKLPTEDQRPLVDRPGVTVRRRPEVAAMMGKSVQTTLYIERRALMKIRKHPEARELYRRWVEEGAPTPQAVEDPGEQLLEYQLQVSEWYCVQEKIVRYGMEEDAAECQTEINKAQAAIGRALEKLTYA